MQIKILWDTELPRRTKPTLASADPPRLKPTHLAAKGASPLQHSGDATVVNIS